MLGDVVVLEPRDFERWLADSHAPIAEAIPKDREDLGANPTFGRDEREALVSKGERMAADHGCLRCHSIDGTPHIGPTWTGLFGSERRFSDGSTEVANEAYITQSMMDPALKVVAGFQPVMPSYHGKIDPAETAAIVEFIKTLHPNDPRASHPNPLPVGGVIRP
jgi:cytochrome c oxidase subunit 2